MTIAELRSTLTGSLVTPSDPDYDSSRAYHSGIGQPDLIVRPSTVDDVVSAVNHAAAESLPIAVRGGGHSAWGTVPGGLLIDLAAFRSIEVDGTGVRVGGGATWGEVADALRPHGLGISSGDTRSVGVGGLTLGGGVGWMVRSWGLAVDQLVGAQLVTAAGEVLEVSDSEHADLFWALRGGGGNFGVVTRFDFQAHELPGVVFGAITVEGDLRPVISSLHEVMSTAPRDLTITLMDVPPMDPSAPAGASVIVCWIGDDEAAARSVIAPLLTAPGVTGEDISVRAYADVLLDMPAPEPGAPMPTFVGGNGFVAELSDETIDALVSMHERTAPSMLFIRTVGGAFSDIEADATAFPVREAEAFVVAVSFAAPDATADEVARLEAEWNAVEALTVGVYGNFADTTETSYVRKMYPTTTKERLATVKRQWDPQNLFSRNHNVLPA